MSEESAQPVLNGIGDNKLTPEQLIAQVAANPRLLDDLQIRKRHF